MSSSLDPRNYQNSSFNNLPAQNSQSTNDVTAAKRDLSFESWLNDEPETTASSNSPSTSSASKTSKKNTSKTKSESKAKAESKPAAKNLIDFDDDKWAVDDDTPWESIDGK